MGQQHHRASQRCSSEPVHHRTHDCRHLLVPAVLVDDTVRRGSTERGDDSAGSSRRARVAFRPLQVDDSSRILGRMRSLGSGFQTEGWCGSLLPIARSTV